MKDIHKTIAVATGVLALGSVALADGAPEAAPQEQPTALEAAAAPLVAETTMDRHAAMDAHEGEAPMGLRKWLHKEPREADPFDGFARPVTNLYFHHPFMWNEIRPLFMYHKFPSSGVLDGGHLKVYAVQAWFQLTEDFQFMASKDGYVDFKPGSFDDDSGFADITLGFKMKFWEDLDGEDGPATVALGLAYETKSGDDDVLEGEGGGFFDVFLSYARSLGSMNFIGTAGAMLPRDGDEDNRTYHWHLHLDTKLGDKIQPLIEINGFHYDSNADRNAGLGPTVPLDIEGFDYTTLGSGDVRGNDVITGAIGFRYRLSEDTSWGLAFEKPLTSREDVLASRWTADVTFRF